MPEYDFSSINSFYLCNICESQTKELKSKGISMQEVLTQTQQLHKEEELNKKSGE